MPMRALGHASSMPLDVLGWWPRGLLRSGAAAVTLDGDRAEKGPAAAMPMRALGHASSMPLDVLADGRGACCGLELLRSH